MTARRLRAYRPPVLAPTKPKAKPRVLVLAPGHFAGDGCTFPEPRHFVTEDES